MMRNRLWARILAFVLAVFFFLGAFLNFFASDETAANYARWGYPDWFHYATAILELATGLLLIPARSSLFGSLLGSAVMLAAAGTVALHGEYIHALPPLIVLGLCLTVIALERKRLWNSRNGSWLSSR